MPRTKTTEPESDQPAIPDVLPVLPLKDAVLFPYIILPLSVSRDASVEAVDRALASHRLLVVATQRDPAEEDPGADGFFPVGTAASVTRMLKLPDGRIRILVQGLARVRLTHIGQVEPFVQARIEVLEDEAPVEHGSPLALEALLRSVKDLLDRAASLGKGISSEVLVIASNLQHPGRLADLTASNLELPAAEARELLEIRNPLARLARINDLLSREVAVLTMQQEISSHARGEMDKSQREYFLRQQLKTIRDELGESDELAQEIAAYRKTADEKAITGEAREELERQVRRLERSHPESAETAIVRTYLDWLTGLPWSTATPDNLDLEHARHVLDEDHYGLVKVKERILEHLAVCRLKGGDTRGPLLCFVGPPGVGKTSLGRSIARALGRQFVRVSLGGVRDEAEIRGHRRTYVGALPGRILQGLSQAKSANPVFMLDEIDKLGTDFRGDPSSALLEVLDPEQNSGFVDHYLGVPFDLSKVMFITTANLLDPVQPAFLDRLEVIPLTGYTEPEKLAIARRHLLPRQLAAHGLGPQDLRLTERGLAFLVSSYTREAGLRNLEREIAALCRKAAVRVASGKRGGRPLSPPVIEKLLGPPRHWNEELLGQDRVGIATGLAWTAAGGDILLIEVAALPGKGELRLTGHLGEVMRESAQAALSCSRAFAERDGVPASWFAEHDLHVHVPAGSVPKDGPSAGVTIATAILSTALSRPIHRRVAMTGEITLRGDILPIGGVREKLMAAHLAGVETVILPRLNRRDLAEVPKEVSERLRLVFAETLDDALATALQAPAEPS
ncbi:MAG TPA: endopeptidase La [Thermoanaerobaculia bacterium]|nr:endopeptidase La [Thermoanaerobaculia bacterium]